METKYTQGEWEWDGDPSNYNSEEEAPWLLANDIQIITGEIRIENPFDAKLIAAAPDLLEALDDVLANTGWYQIGSEALEKAKKAIKKATE